MLFTLLASSLAIATNWTIYIWAVTHNRVLEGSLGYFINPLITFLFAAFFFGERFRPLQLAAVGVAAAGVLNQTLVVGEFPWISLSLAVSFAIYGAIRKTTPVDSRVGFGMEAIWLAPLAALYLLFFLPAGTHAFGDGDPGFVTLLLLAGPFTGRAADPVCDGGAAPALSTIGVLQYIGPEPAVHARAVAGRAVHVGPCGDVRPDLDRRHPVHASPAASHASPPRLSADSRVRTVENPQTKTPPMLSRSGGRSLPCEVAKSDFEIRIARPAPHAKPRILTQKMRDSSICAQLPPSAFLINLTDDQRGHRDNCLSSRDAGNAALALHAQETLRVIYRGARGVAGAIVDFAGFEAAP